MSFADAGCILKVDFRCESCKYKLLEVLSSVIGVYNIDLDGDLVKITGEVDPNRLFKAVARTGYHAKIIKASFKHPSWDPYNSTSLDYHQMPTTYPMDYGHQYHPAMHGGGSHMHYPFGGAPEFAEQYPFQHPTMHGGHGYHHRRRHPPMGPGGAWYPPPQGFGGMNGLHM